MGRFRFGSSYGFGFWHGRFAELVVTRNGDGDTGRQAYEDNRIKPTYPTIGAAL